MKLLENRALLSSRGGACTHHCPHHAEDELAVVVARVEPVEESGARAAHVQVARGGGREAHAHGAVARRQFNVDLLRRLFGWCSTRSNAEARHGGPKNHFGVKRAFLGNNTIFFSGVNET